MARAYQKTSAPQTVSYEGAIQKIESGEPGPLVIVAPVKGPERAKEKVDADYGGDWSMLHDAVRGTIAVDRVDEIPKVIESVLRKLQAAGWTIAKAPKNRFENPTSAGYRDILLNLQSPQGLITELQINTKPMIAAKDKGHKIYERVRTIEARASIEKRELTDEEAASREAANAEMQQLYLEAWEASKSAASF